jgi:hypothetical protein
MAHLVVPVAPDGDSIHAVFENKESGKVAFDFKKQKQK